MFQSGRSVFTETASVSLPLLEEKLFLSWVPAVYKILCYMFYGMWIGNICLFLTNLGGVGSRIIMVFSSALLPWFSYSSLVRHPQYLYKLCFVPTLLLEG